MIHNHILDILRGRVTPSNIKLNDDMDRPEIARMIRGAEIFSFDAIPLEPYMKDGKEFWKIPEITAEELDMFYEGLIPIPSDYCWYEFTIGSPDYRSALLVHKIGDELQVMRFDYAHSLGDGVMDGVWVTRSKEGEFACIADIETLRALYKNNVVTSMSYTGNWSLAMYLTLMINSKTTEMSVVPKREKTAEEKSHNRHALPAHRIVMLVPTRFIRGEDQGGTHASPRLHWRRSHVREYRAPSGAVYHRTVVVRHLVGRAELGTVTHEYKVKS